MNKNIENVLNDVEISYKIKDAGDGMIVLMYSSEEAIASIEQKIIEKAKLYYKKVQFSHDPESHEDADAVLNCVCPVKKTPKRLKIAENKKELKKRWAKWCKCFDGNDFNSINPQITRMLQYYAIWNLFNSLREDSKKASDGTTSENRILYDTINEWFFETQKMAIRRLIDNYGIDGKRGVYSLMSVLKEIKINAKWLTRENIFELRGLQYDYAPLIKEEKKWLSEPCNGLYRPIPPELDYESCVDLHELIDKLSKTSEEKREKSDTIDKEFLKHLEAELTNKCEKFEKYVNKFHAHAATEESREEISAEDIRFILEEYKKAHELICQDADFIQVLLMDKSTGFLPLMPPDLFSHWDKPIFQGDNSKLDETVNKIWGDYEAETKKWRQWDFPPFDEIKKRKKKKWLSLAEKTRRI